MFRRIISLPEKRSFFLLGPRGSGKSTLIKEKFCFHQNSGGVIWIDLLEPEVEQEFAARPQRLMEVGQKLGYGSRIIIDEIQKVPKLLDAAHKLIQEKKCIFVFTGSSARKLKRGAANLLAGRAAMRTLYPLTTLEFGDQFDLENCLSFGSLPEVANITEVSDKKDFLRSYALSYLREEIQIEQLVRNVPVFRRFLDVAAQMNGNILNFRSLSKDIGADDKTVQSYYQILEDTLIGFFLHGWSRSIRKQQTKSPKFYLFDPGIKRSLEGVLGVPLKPSTNAYGTAFEHWVIIEAIRYNDYFQKDYRFSYLMSKDGAEVDLVIDRPGMKSVFVEVKSSKTTHERDIHNLKILSKGLRDVECQLWSLAFHSARLDKIDCHHWLKGMREVGLIP